MRTIKKRAPPAELVQWRAARMTPSRAPGMECTYDELRRNDSVLKPLEDALFAEQGEICAYTGRRITLQQSGSGASDSRFVDFHVEHLNAQAHCAYGADTEYTNLVACWPRPNCGFEPTYGARKKGSWPKPHELQYFVSPLRQDCTARFAFNHRGEISPANKGDTAAAETIRRLGLDDTELVELRKRTIEGALGPNGQWLSLEQARRLLVRLDSDVQSLDRGVSVRLMPFWFAVRQALERRIRKLERSRRET